MSSDAPTEVEHLRLAAEIAGVRPAEVVAPGEHDVVLCGLRLHYLDWGRRGLRPIVFLHGGALCSRSLDVVCLALRTRYHCIALDQRGHGDSEWSPTLEYGPEAHAGDVAALLGHLGLRDAVLVGQSMGALNAFTFTRLHPESVAALVIVDAGPGVRAPGASSIVNFVRDTAEVDSPETFVEQALAFQPRRDPRLLRWSSRHHLRRLASGKWVRKHDMRHFGGADAAGIAERLRPYWNGAESVTCPVLVVRGSESEVLLDEDAERFAWQMPKGRWVRVEDAGHNVQGDNPRALVECLRAFLDDVGL